MYVLKAGVFGATRRQSKEFRLEPLLSDAHHSYWELVANPDYEWVELWYKDGVNKTLAHSHVNTRIL